MKVIAVQSGSNGNCIYVQSGDVSLVFDAGLPGRHAHQRLARHGVDITAAAGLLISHDHSDHVRCAGVFHRMFHLPLHMTARTWEASQRHALGPIDDVRPFEAGSSIRFAGLTVETIPTPHDAADGVAFVVDDGRRRVGILTDLGHVFAGLANVIASLDAVVLESNYDPAMLDGGSYPEFLKQRIRGPRGHISNIEAAELLRRSAGPRLKWACLAHLSQDNNHPYLALQTHRDVLGDTLPLHLASRYEATGVLEV